MMGICFDPEPRPRTYEPTMQLRWAVPPETTLDIYRLQQAWRCREDGSLDWRDVPREVVVGLAPRR